jgi:hypothetical protein
LIHPTHPIHPIHLTLPENAMLVRAAPGLKVPKEEQPRDYIEGDTPVTVPESAYYLRRLADGSLLLVIEVAPTEPLPSAPRTHPKTAPGQKD